MNNLPMYFFSNSPAIEKWRGRALEEGGEKDVNRMRQALPKEQQEETHIPVLWRFTKVVLPVPPSPTRMSLNLGAFSGMADWSTTWKRREKKGLARLVNVDFKRSGTHEKWIIFLTNTPYTR